MSDKHIFEKSAGEKAFWLSNGQKIDSIKDLYRILDNINDEVFAYHVNSERNDFSTWIKGVFHEKDLAEKISKIQTKKKIKSAIGGWIYESVHKKVKLNHRPEKKPIQKEEIKETKKNIVKETIQDDLEGPHNSRKFFTGIIDFVLGFIVGILSMLIFINMVV